MRMNKLPWMPYHENIGYLDKFIFCSLKNWRSSLEPTFTMSVMPFLHPDAVTVIASIAQYPLMVVATRANRSALPPPPYLPPSP